jgi:MEDS: MEthanogen/methylotroph, DcmR Sensory domain
MLDSETAWILAKPPHHAHIVYPYTDDRPWVSAVGFYTSSGLAGNGSVILIATETHRYAIKRYLSAHGNVDVLEANGQLLLLDAAELLSSFMVDRKPDPRLFKAGIKTLIQGARFDQRTGRERKVRIFGEMASLLWPSNNAAAESLEKLGNEVMDEYSIPIL